MFPEINIFGRTFTYYSIMVFVGVILIILLSMKVSEKSGLDYYRMLCTMTFSFIGVALGGVILYAIVNCRYAIAFFMNMDDTTPVKDLMLVLRKTFGGTVFYGGMIGSILMSLLFLKLSKKYFGDDNAPYIDIGAFCIPLFHTFGRLGCFLSGCCYGIECDFGVTYRYSLLEPANGPTRFPVQLCEAMFNLALFFVLYNMYKKGKMKNKLLAVYLIIYPIGRFLLEFLRGDAHRGYVIGWVSTSQFISILLVIIAGTYLIVKRNSNKATELNN